MHAMCLPVLARGAGHDHLIGMTARLLGKTMGAGIVATGAMSVFMLAMARAGLLGQAPPHKLTRRFLRLWSAAPRPGSVRGATGLSHFAFGAAAALPFPALIKRLSNRGARVAAGAIYGGAIWAAMYQVALPALGLMPKPREDRPGRPTSMLLAHVIYGGVLGALTGRLRAKQPVRPDAAAMVH